MASCQVCDNNERKYKCPSCDIRYCSVSCYKQHKETQCDELTRLKQESASKYVEDKEPSRLMLYETIDTVPVEKLEKLGESEELKELLKNPNLRNYLKEIDGAIKPWNAMKLAMQEPLFTEFADACLKIVQEDNEKSNKV